MSAPTFRGMLAAAGLGLAVPLAAGLVWGGLVRANLRAGAWAPWSVPLMAVLLFAGFRWLGGAGGPRSTSAWRRRHLRAAAVSGPAWRLALPAGAAATAALAGLWIFLSRASGFPPNVLPDVGGAPIVTWLPLLAMGSLVAPLAEEAGFRGYLQRALEDRFGAVRAISLSALLFALAHLQHGAVLEKQLVYLLGGVAWGLLALLTGSIWPGIVAHAFTDVVFFTAVWPSDGRRAALVLDLPLLGALALVAAGTALAAWAFVGLGKLRAEGTPAG